jgi:hypothetical protein
LIGVVGTAAAGCGGPQRSAQAFCATFQREAVRLHDKYQAQVGSLDVDADPLGSLATTLGTALEAQGDLVVLFDRLDKVAPDEIEPEVAAVRDAMKKQVDAAGDALKDPLGALGSALLNGLTNMGSYNAVDQYIQSNCDLSFEKGG